MLNVDQFLSTLPIMLKGMGGIFIMTAAIILCIALLNRVSNAAAKKQGDSRPND